MIAISPTLTAFVLIPLPLMSFLIYKVSAKMNFLSKKNGWFVPVSTLLDFLKAKNKTYILSAHQKARLEWKWLADKIFLGST